MPTRGTGCVSPKDAGNVGAMTVQVYCTPAGDKVLAIDDTEIQAPPSLLVRIVLVGNTQVGNINDAAVNYRYTDAGAVVTELGGVVGIHRGVIVIESYGTGGRPHGAVGRDVFDIGITVELGKHGHRHGESRAVSTSR